MKRSAGFTLIETMIVILIVGALLAMAYPSYHGYIVRTRRVEGLSALIDIMQQQERYFSQNNTYIAFTSASTDPQERRFKWWSGNSAAVSSYELSAVACPGRAIANCVEVRATPGTSLVDIHFQDRECETLIINSDGAHAASTQAPRCWP